MVPFRQILHRSCLLRGPARGLARNHGLLQWVQHNLTMLRMRNAEGSDLVASQLLDIVEAAWNSIAEGDGKTTLAKASEESESEDDDEEGNENDSKVDDLSEWAQAEFESVVESFHSFLDCGGGGGRVEIRRRTAALRSKMMLRTRRKEEEEI